MAPNEIYKITIYLALINYWIQGHIYTVLCTQATVLYNIVIIKVKV